MEAVASDFVATGGISAMSVTVSFLSGDRATVSLPAGARARDLRVKVAVLRGMIPEAVSLLIEGVEAQDDRMVPLDTTVTVVVASGFEAIESFDRMGLSLDILDAIRALGCETPSYLQQRSIKPMIDGRDIVAVAESGTGKTTAAAVGSLQLVDRSLMALQVLILVPRDLDSTIRSHYVRRLAGGHRVNVRGLGDHEDVSNLEEQHLLLGAPGRVHDAILSNSVKLENLRVLVIDDIDDILSRGFGDQTRSVVGSCHHDVQMCIFSSTTPPEVVNFCKHVLRDPVHIFVEGDRLMFGDVRHCYIAVENEESKLDALVNLCKTLPITQAVVFCNTHRKAEFLEGKLSGWGITASTMCKEPGRNEHEVSVGEFQAGSSRLLISSNALSSNCASSVPLVLNFDVSPNIESYLRRIGQTGSCADQRRIAISFVTPHDARLLEDIEKRYNIHVEEMPTSIATSA